MHIVISGANRGLGLGFVRHYLAQGHHVWACCRDPEQATALHDLTCNHLHLVRWDVSTDDAPQCATNDQLPNSIDLLINNAGIYGPGKQGQTLEGVTVATMSEVFNVDAIGPLRVVQTLLPRLRQGHAVIANISSKMGSVSDNGSGGTYAYRAAKSALIIISKSMSVDLAGDGIHVITLHPGWVQTDMTQQTGLIDVTTSVAGMTRVIAQADQYEAGAFIAYDGQIVPF
jgi:NAD(P)-dependent dehydrogenase (short-subunit alcohol dehydrogenase family)